MLIRSILRLFVFIILPVVSVCISCTGHDHSQEAGRYPLPPGHYPGDPAENFSALHAPGGDTYRNVALHRASWHATSYDYNLTAQLITDGIVDTVMPWTLTAATSTVAPLNKRERESLTDDNPVTTVKVEGSGIWVSMGLLGRRSLPEVDGIRLVIPLWYLYNGKKGPWECRAWGSDDGKTWTLLSTAKGYGDLVDTTFFPLGKIFMPTLSFSAPAHYRYYKMSVRSPVMQQWLVGEFVLLHRGRPLELKPSLHFVSAWMSEDDAPQWLITDLGAPARLDSIVLHWIVPPRHGEVFLSDDRHTWRSFATFSGTKKNVLTAVSSRRGRYLKIVMDEPAGGHYFVLSEVEAWGSGGLVTTPHPAAPPGKNKMLLAGGRWKLQRASQTPDDPYLLSRPGYDDSRWLPATVPGTVLSSYLDAGALPDPNYGDNQLMVSESFFLGDFWYRNVFSLPSSFRDRTVWLHFDGINWKAEVWLNGTLLDRIDGAFTRTQFNITSLLREEGPNVLLVKIHPNAHPGGVKEKTFESPGLNGGVLGADNPTFHATIGWDWIPTIRGRDAGIWNDVWLQASGPVTLHDPSVITHLPLPDTTTADISILVQVTNHSDQRVKGKLQGSFGKISFETPVELEAKATKRVVFNPSTHPQLHLSRPRLWWPNGYGRPNLYDVHLAFVTPDGQVSDQKDLRTGIRQMDYDTTGNKLKIFVNGIRITPRGGNWGFSESMLRYRAREYDAAVRYHRDMHFTMIRNWVGMTGDEEFWEACDKYGILVWQDFWLANPWDGPDPDDNLMFLDNARDLLLRLRNHPSIALYCGRNEGYPPKALDQGLRELVNKYHPGILYIPNSAADVVSGHGPYRAMPLKYYFAERATRTLHSEMGMPNIMTLESMRATLPDSALWPQGRMWGLHDYCASGAQSAISFNKLVKEKYGGAEDLRDWLTLAQFVNYDGYRAMFEAQGRHRMGLLLWMSHPAWPSLTWQTYDYYLEPTAAYFGAKKACEPLHIQWNVLTDSVEVINYSGRDGGPFTARIQIFNAQGQEVSRSDRQITLPADTLIRVAALPSNPSCPLQFLRLTLLDSSRVISRNLYLRGDKEGNLTAIHELKKATVTTATTMNREGETWHLTTTLHNNSDTPALMIRLKVVRHKSGDRILPVLYSDNYITLMPGESRTLHIEVKESDCRGEKPDIQIEGFNVKERKKIKGK